MMSEQARSTPIKVFQNREKKLCCFSALLLVVNPTQPSLLRFKVCIGGIKLQDLEFFLIQALAWVHFWPKNSAKVWIFFMH